MFYKIYGAFGISTGSSNLGLIVLKEGGRFNKHLKLIIIRFHKSESKSLANAFSSKWAYRQASLFFKMNR